MVVATIGHADLSVRSVCSTRNLVAKCTCVRNVFPFLESEFFTGFGMPEKRDFTYSLGGRI